MYDDMTHPMPVSSSFEGLAEYTLQTSPADESSVRAYPQFPIPWISTTHIVHHNRFNTYLPHTAGPRKSLHGSQPISSCAKLHHNKLWWSSWVRVRIAVPIRNLFTSSPLADMTPQSRIVHILRRITNERRVCGTVSRAIQLGDFVAFLISKIPDKDLKISRPHTTRMEEHRR